MHAVLPPLSDDQREYTPMVRAQLQRLLFSLTFYGKPLAHMV